MKKQITHNQHYVWREYLKPWGDQKGEKVYVWWNNQKLTNYTDVFDILREKDFYEYKPLNKLELYCLKEIFAKTKNNIVKSVNSNLIELIDIISSINKEIIETELIKDFLIQAGEEVQSTIEKSGIKYLVALRQGNFSPFTYDDNGEMIDFFVFLLFQFFRTKGNRDNVVNALSEGNNEIKELYRKSMGDNTKYDLDWNKIYNLGYVFTINQVCYTMVNNNAHIKLMRANNVKFIVSDQPVYNSAKNTSKDFDLFYPITPDIAILVSNSFSENQETYLTDNEVLSMNEQTVKNAHKFIIGVNKNYIDFNWGN